MKRHLFTFFLILIFLLPLVIIFLRSITGIWQYPDIFPETLSLRAWSYVAENGRRILLSVGSSFGYSFAAICITLVCCYVPASVLAGARFRGKTVIEAALILPAILPPITFAVGGHLLFIFLRIADSWFGVVLILSVYSYPYMLRSLMLGFKAVGREYSVCAENLGAGFFRRAALVEVPALLPSIYAGAVLVFLVSFSEYFLVFLIGGGLVPAVSSYVLPFLRGSDFALASALVIVFFAAPAVLFFGLDSILGRVYRGRSRTG